MRRGSLERVDGRGVLRPDHEVRAGASAGRDVGGEPLRWPSTWLSSTCSALARTSSARRRARCPGPRATVTGRRAAGRRHGSRRPPAATATASRDQRPRPRAGAPRARDSTPTASSAAEQREQRRSPASRRRRQRAARPACPTTAKASRPHGKPAERHACPEPPPSPPTSAASHSGQRRQPQHRRRSGAPSSAVEQRLEHRQQRARRRRRRPCSQDSSTSRTPTPKTRPSQHAGRAAGARAEQDQRRDARAAAASTPVRGRERQADRGTGQRGRPGASATAAVTGGCRLGDRSRRRHDGVLPGTSLTTGTRSCRAATVRRSAVERCRRSLPDTGGPAGPSDRPAPAGCRDRGRCLLGDRALSVSRPVGLSTDLRRRRRRTWYAVPHLRVARSLDAEAAARRSARWDRGETLLGGAPAAVNRAADLRGRAKAQVSGAVTADIDDFTQDFSVSPACRLDTPTGTTAAGPVSVVGTGHDDGAGRGGRDDGWSSTSAADAAAVGRRAAGRPPSTANSSVRGCGVPTRRPARRPPRARRRPGPAPGTARRSTTRTGPRRRRCGCTARWRRRRTARGVGAVDEVAGVVGVGVRHVAAVRRRVSPTSRVAHALTWRGVAPLPVGDQRVDEVADATSPGVVPRPKTRSTPSSAAIVSSNRGPPTTSSGRRPAG